MWYQRAHTRAHVHTHAHTHSHRVEALPRNITRAQHMCARAYVCERAYVCVSARYVCVLVQRATSQHTHTHKHVYHPIQAGMTDLLTYRHVITACNQRLTSIQASNCRSLGIQACNNRLAGQAYSYTYTPIYVCATGGATRP